jgi:hypothetical protein
MMTERKSGGDAVDTQTTGNSTLGYGGNPAFNMGPDVGVMPADFPFQTAGNTSQSNPDQQADANAQGGDAGTDNKVYGS